MDIPVRCQCGRVLSVPEEQAGQDVLCANCGATLVVPIPPSERGPAIRIDETDLPPASPAANDWASSVSPTPTASSVSDPSAGQVPPHAMKANRRLAGQVCAICQAQIQLAEDIRICEHCKLPFHCNCWEENEGCGTYGCKGATGSGSNQPEADFALSPSQLSGGESVSQGSNADEAESPPLSEPYRERRPAGDAQAPPRNHAKISGLAVASLVLGLSWLYGLGSVLAILFGHMAISEIDRSPGETTGRGMALAGLILGYLGVALLLLSMLAGSSQHNPSHGW